LADFHYYFSRVCCTDFPPVFNELEMYLLGCLCSMHASAVNSKWWASQSSSVPNWGSSSLCHTASSSMSSSRVLGSLCPATQSLWCGPCPCIADTLEMLLCSSWGAGQLCIFLTESLMQLQKQTFYILLNSTTRTDGGMDCFLTSPCHVSVLIVRMIAQLSFCFAYFAQWLNVFSCWSLDSCWPFYLLCNALQVVEPPSHLPRECILSVRVCVLEFYLLCRKFWGFKLLFLIYPFVLIERNTQSCLFYS
jgi:hypothetical protein